MAFFLIVSCKDIVFLSFKKGFGQKNKDKFKYSIIAV